MLAADTDGVKHNRQSKRFRQGKRFLAPVPNLFQPEIDSFHQAVDEFQTQVPELAKSLVQIIATAHQSNKKFQAAFDDFFALCRTALNLNISQAAVDEMLVQHLLTARSSVAASGTGRT